VCWGSERSDGCGVAGGACAWGGSNCRPCSEVWFHGGIDSVRLMVGLDDLGGLLQPECFYSSVCPKVRGSRGQLLAGLCLSPAPGAIHVCTASHAEGGVFKELVTLNRRHLLCWASYLMLEQPECQRELPLCGSLTEHPEPTHPACQGLGERTPPTRGTCAVHRRKVLPGSGWGCTKAGCPPSEGV